MKSKHLSLVQEGSFEDSGTAKIDAKHRLLIKGPVAEHYRMFCNDAGQILLDPQVMLPAREAWLFKNKDALASVRQGLKESAEGKGRYIGSFARYARETPDK